MVRGKRVPAQFSVLRQVLRGNYAYREAYCVLSTKSKYFWRISLGYNLIINIIAHLKMCLCNRRILEIVISLYMVSSELVGRDLML